MSVFRLVMTKVVAPFAIIQSAIDRPKARDMPIIQQVLSVSLKSVLSSSVGVRIERTADLSGRWSAISPLAEPSWLFAQQELGQAEQYYKLECMANPMLS